MQEKTWDYTALDTFLTCRRKYYWRMVRHLSPIGVAPALMFGLAIHDALDAHYSKGPEAGLNKFRETYKDTEGDEIRTVANGIKMLEHYARIYKHEPFKVIGVPETGFVFPIGEYLWGGRIDLPVEWDNDLYIVEHKTTATLRNTYFKQFDLNMQVTSYILAAEEFLGRKCQGCVINVLEPWKELIRPTAKSKRPEDHFARKPMTRTKMHKDAFRENIPRIIKDILWCEKNDQFYPNEHACFSYNYDCPYKTLCMYGEDERFIARDYKVDKWEPYKTEEKDNGGESN